MKKLMVIALALGAFGACSKDTKKKSEPVKVEPAKPAGQDQAPPPADKPTAPSPTAGFPAGNYEIDAGHSALIWRAKHFGAGYTYGWFKDFSGKFVVDADPTKQSLELTVKVDSLDSRDAKRDEHLKGPDFFNAAQFATITFKSTKVEAAGAALKVTGDLNIHGVTKSVTVDVNPVGTGTDPWKNVRAGYEAKLTINRMDYGVAFMPEGISSDIDLTIAFEGVKK
jgi:polyisoprenoid-binding protein YceI